MAKRGYVLLSHRLNPQTPGYGNRDRLVIKEKSRIKQGDSANSSEWAFSSNHLGSHVDMPNHFFDRGKTITDYPVEAWIFPNVCLIDIPCTAARLIGPGDLGSGFLPGEGPELLLIRTGYERYRGSEKYWSDNPGLAPALGQWLREQVPTLRAVGFDFISLTSWQYREQGREAHRAFLDPERPGNPLWLLEDLSLEKVTGKLAEVIVSPLMVENSNGSPVTVIAELS